MRETVDQLVPPSLLHRIFAQGRRYRTAIWSHISFHWTTGWALLYRIVFFFWFSVLALADRHKTCLWYGALPAVMAAAAIFVVLWFGPDL